MSTEPFTACESRDALIATVQTTQRAARDAQWRAWLAASEARGQGGAMPDIADLTHNGRARRRWSNLGWRLLRGLPVGALAMVALMS